MKKKFSLMILLLGVGIWAGAELASIFTTKAIVLLCNRSGADIERVQVSIGDASISFSNIPRGKAVYRYYEIPGDAHFDVRISFGPGKEIVLLDAGYVTSGLEACDVFEVYSDRIVHEKVNNNYVSQ